MCSADSREVCEFGPVELTSASVDAESGNCSSNRRCRSIVGSGSMVEQDAGPLGNGAVAQSGKADDRELKFVDRELCVYAVLS